MSFVVNLSACIFQSLFPRVFVLSRCRIITCKRDKFLLGRCMWGGRDQRPCRACNKPDQTRITYSLPYILFYFWTGYFTLLHSV